MSDIDLDELERLAKAATTRPWMHKERVIIPHFFPYEPKIGSTLSKTDAAYIVDACNALPDLIKRVRELEGRLAEIAKDNGRLQQIIRILENKVCELKGKPIPMEPRLPTCDDLVRPRYILQSNCSNAKEIKQ